MIGRKLIISAAVILLILAGLIVAPGLIDWSKHKDAIVTQLHDATGLDFEIGGDLRLSILPYPHAAVGNLTVTNPASAGDPLLRLERADVSLALMPLFSGKVDVSSVTLIKPVMFVQVASGGAPSWQTQVLQQKMKTGGGKKEGGLGESITLNEITIKQGALRYVDKGRGMDYAVEGLDLELSADSLSGPFNLSGSAVYKGEPVRLSAKTGRLESGVKSVALQVNAELPSAQAKSSFSGVVAFDTGLEIQGETALESAKPVALAKLAGGSAALPDIASKPFSVRGILTFSPKEISYKNMKLLWAGSDFSGSVAVKPVAESKRRLVDVKLLAAKPVDTGSFFPVAKTVSVDKGADTKKKPAADFLPATMSVPGDLDVSLSVEAPAVKYQALDLAEAKLNAAWNGQKAETMLEAKLPDGGSFSFAGSLGFASASRTEKTGAVTMADPALSYRMDVKTPDPAKTILVFLPAQNAKAAQEFLKGAASVALEGTLKPSSLSVSRGQLGLRGMTFDIGGSSYVRGKKGGHDKVAAVLKTGRLDVDALTGKKQEKSAAQTAAAPVAQEAAIKGAVEKLALPFDLDLQAAAASLKLKGQEYKNLQLAATLVSRSLNLKTFSLQDEGGNSLTLSGSATDITALKDMNFTVQGKTSNLRPLLDGFKVKTEKLPQSLKEAELLAVLKGQPDNLAFTANVKAMGGTVEAAGAIADALGKPALGALTVRARHPNYVEVMRLFKPDFSSGVGIKKALDVYAAMKKEGNAYSFNNVQAVIGPTEFKGDIQADLSGKKPVIVAKVQAGELPLDEILGHDAKRKGSVRVEPQRKGEDLKWSRDPIDTAWLHQANVDFTGAARSLSYGPWMFSNPKIVLSLKDGVLTLSQLDGDIAGGKGSVTGKASSSAPGQVLVVDGKVSLQNVSLESFVSAFSGSRLIRAKGLMSMDTSVATTGGSAAALIFDLHGQGKASGSNFVFEGFDLARLSQALAEPSKDITSSVLGLLNATLEGGMTSFDKMNANWMISQGVITLSDTYLTGPAARIDTVGTINLPLWALNLENTVKLASPPDAPPLKVVFKGPLDRPVRTFGKSPFESYAQKIIGEKVQDVIVDQLKKSGLLDKIAPPVAQPQTAPVTQPQGAPQPAQPAQPTQPIRPEDVFRGVLEGVLQGQ